MKILLDENFPLALLPTLRENGYEAEHIILLQLRGTSDATIAHRLKNEDLLFITQDQDFLELPLSRSPVIVSRVTQSLPMEVRIDISGSKRLRSISLETGRKNFSKCYDDGELVAWEVRPLLR
jgi:predicted nuclease of predicted toxin-antitoxin system